MHYPEILAQDTARLAALYRTELLDTAPEKRFDSITRLAKQYFNVAIATITLIDAERQWFKSKDGISDSETDLSVSFCVHAIAEDDVMYVEDARKDPRFANTQNVLSGPMVRFYAGAVVRSSDDQPLGTLCVFDPQPRVFTESDFEMLKKFRDMVNTEILTSEGAKAE
ncbi:GAF domain-containing protein [Alteromonas flava]|uniref:GAF domain-containing protein n=1 Tax=Alteromonas flava TaxID=2048003 RepID=UPI000C283CC3|nr:GAF domain-containing protein [Alteromonas flava]